MKNSFYSKLISCAEITKPPSPNEMYELWMHSQQFKGWVYIAENKVNTGLLKVGYTQKDPFIRARSLKTAGVVGTFKALYAVQMVDCIRSETEAHQLLSPYQHDGETFRVDIKTASGCLQQVWRQERAALSFFKTDYLLHGNNSEVWAESGFDIEKWFANNEQKCNQLTSR